MPTKKPAPHRPVSIVLQSEITTGKNLKLSDDDAGWTYGAVAQFYQMVNEHLFYFFPDSGAKTIRERVPAGRVKIHDGHSYNYTLSETLGRVLEASEAPREMRYTGFVSRAHEEAAQKLADGTIDENSMEIFRMKTVPFEVEIDLVPETSRPYVNLTTEGLAVVEGIVEYRWEAIGLVSSSSQGRRAIFDPPVLVQYQDLAVSGGDWQPEKAAASLAAWEAARGRGEPPRLRQYAYLASFRGGDGDEVLAGQIARAEGDDLVVCREALEPALADLSAALAKTDLSDDAKERVMDAACLRVGRYLSKGSPLTERSGSGKGNSDGDGNAAPELLSATSKEAGPGESGAPATEADSQKAAEPDITEPLTVGSDEAAARAARIAHLSRRARIDALNALVREVLPDVPAGTGRGPTAAGRTGP